MNAKSTQEQQLKREIRWAKEALAIVDNCATYDSILRAIAEEMPLEYRHLAETMDTDELESHIERLENDYQDLQEGEF